MAGMSGTTPENMELFLVTCISSTAVPKAYLKSIGVSEAEIDQLKVRLGQAG
jgi:protein-tyrosine phosphatase